MINPLTVSGAIVLLPFVATAFLIYFLYRQKHSEAKTRRYMYFVLGFVFLTMFYVVIPDPELIQSLYINQGDYTTPITWSFVGAVLLFLSIYVFRKHLEG